MKAMMAPGLKNARKQQICFMYKWCIVQPPLLKTRRYSFSRLQTLDRRTAVAHESLGGTDMECHSSQHWLQQAAAGQICKVKVLSAQIGDMCLSG